jgi:hypothetical protein
MPKATGTLTSAEATVITDFASSSMTLATAGQSSAFTVGTSTPSMIHYFLNMRDLGIISHKILISSS